MKTHRLENTDSGSSAAICIVDVDMNVDRGEIHIIHDGEEATQLSKMEINKGGIKTVVAAINHWSREDFLSFVEDRIGLKEWGPGANMGIMAYKDISILTYELPHSGRAYSSFYGKEECMFTELSSGSADPEENDLLRILIEYNAATRIALEKEEYEMLALLERRKPEILRSAGVAMFNEDDILLK